MNKFARTVVGAASVVVLTAALGACGGDDDGDGGGSDSKTIALLLPETKTTRYEAFDKPLFEAKVKELCDDCDVKYLNADQDSAKQQQQAEAADRAQGQPQARDPSDQEDDADEHGRRTPVEPRALHPRIVRVAGGIVRGSGHEQRESEPNRK